MYFGPHTNVWNTPWPESAGEVIQLLPGILVAPAPYHQDQQPLVEQSGTIDWPGSNMFWEEQVTPNRRAGLQTFSFLRRQKLKTITDLVYSFDFMNCTLTIMMSF